MSFPFAIVFSILVIALCLLTLLRLLFRRFRSLWEWVIFLPGSLLSFWVILWEAPWAFMSYYLRWLFAGIYVIALIVSYFKLSARVKKQNTSFQPRWIWIAWRVIMMAVPGFIILTLINSYHYTGQAVALRFPFHKGNYYVMQGGASGLSNPFHRFFSKTMHGYAMDVAKLNSYMNRAGSMQPDSLREYAIYGDTVLAPAAGRVLLTVSDVPNNPPGRVNKVQIHGNHMIIQCEGYRIFMAHFQAGSIFVQPGDIIKAGQPVGTIGNSGFTVEPHLHISVWKGYTVIDPKADKREKLNTVKLYDSPLYDGYSVPFLFDGRFYSINDIMKAGK